MFGTTVKTLLTITGVILIGSISYSNALPDVIKIGKEKIGDISSLSIRKR